MLAHLATAAFASSLEALHKHKDELIYDGFPRLSSAVGWVSICCWIIVSRTPSFAGYPLRADPRPPPSSRCYCCRCTLLRLATRFAQSLR